MRTNQKASFRLKTHEGAPAHAINPVQQLRRVVMSSLLWESQCYVDGQEIAEAVRDSIERVAPDVVAKIAIEAREAQKLRHMPLFIVREMARIRSALYKAGRRSEADAYPVAETLARVIQRADELAEFLALYWKEGKCPLSAQVKQGLAQAFNKFNEYQLAKYDRDAAVKLRDVLFLCHAKPTDAQQAEVWKRLVEGKLQVPDTWEVNLSAGAGNAKKATWERLLKEGKLGALALLRNLRNMHKAQVDEHVVGMALDSMKVDRVLPFRFIAAARAVPVWEELIEAIMVRAASKLPKLVGRRTILLIDVSGSMDQPLSAKSDMRRLDAACGVAIYVREIAEGVRVFTFSRELVEVPPRRGFALRDAIVNSQRHGATYLGDAMRLLNQNVKYDRLVVITDEQSHDDVPMPMGAGYMINVASYQRGVGYGNWTHIDGWSENVVDFIREVENEGM